MLVSPYMLMFVAVPGIDPDTVKLPDIVVLPNKLVLPIWVVEPLIKTEPVKFELPNWLAVPINVWEPVIIILHLILYFLLKYYYPFEW